MNEELIKNLWQIKVENIDASVDMWDSLASEYKNFQLPTIENDKILAILNANGFLKKDATFLDIGCGTGKYAFALSNFCKSVIGIDLSPKMIAYAKDYSKINAFSNVTFESLDWYTADLEKKGWKNHFDFVFANLSPGIQSGETFEKMLQASKKGGFLSKPIHREDLITKNIFDLLSIDGRQSIGMEDFLFAFQLLLLKGFLPKIEYITKISTQQRTLKQSYDYYLNRIKILYPLSEEETQKIILYLNSIAVDGIIHEELHVTIGILYWTNLNFNQS